MMVLLQVQSNQFYVLGSPLGLVINIAKCEVYSVNDPSFQPFFHLGLIYILSSTNFKLPHNGGFVLGWPKAQTVPSAQPILWTGGDVATHHNMFRDVFVRDMSISLHWSSGGGREWLDTTS